MKGNATKPPPGLLRCAKCSTAMKLCALDDEVFNFSYEGHRCPKCENTVLTMEQLDRYNELRDWARGAHQRRRVHRVGNSLGITLPASFKRYIHEGMLIEVDMVDHRTIRLRVVSNESPTTQNGARRETG